MQAYFNASQHLVRIRWSSVGMDVRPGQPAWEHAKWVWRCSALVGTTAVEHLMGNHLIYSNVGATATREHLAKDHPIRRFVKPHTHRTPLVNMGAFRFLTVENSLLHRTVALTYAGLRDAFLLSLNTIRLSGNPLQSLQAAAEQLGDAFPYAQDGFDLYRVIHDYVTAYVGVYYADDDAVRGDAALGRVWRAVRVLDNSGIVAWQHASRAALADIIAAYIFHVTGQHHVVRHSAAGGEQMGCGDHDWPSRS